MSATERLARLSRHDSMEAASPFATLPWQRLGPTNISGRVTDVAVAEPRGDTYTMYVGAAAGGVWKTENEGVTWTHVFRDQVTASIGDVAIAPSNPDHVWVGTGEANLLRSSHAGAGVYASEDGGVTWTHRGLTETHTIGRIRTHPTDPHVVWVAAGGHAYRDNPERGVYRTSDGGRSWRKVLYVDEMTGAIDLVLHPDDPDVLYAATWQRRRARYNDPRNEPAFTGSDAYFTGSGVWKSTDGGEHWIRVEEGLPDARYRGRIGLDVARSRPETVYAFIDNYEVAGSAADGSADAYGRPSGSVIKGATVYRSDDGGRHWSQTSRDGAQMEGLGGTYGWVFGQIRVDPNDAERVYVLGIRLHVSQDGGRSFRALDGMHVDQHGLYIDPNNSDYLVANNDGGVYVSYDGGGNWRFFVDLPVVTFFNVAYDFGDPFRVYGSVQDHGSYSRPVDLSRGRHRIPTVAWQRAPGGEASRHAVDPHDPDVVYSAGFYGTLTRTDLSTGESRSIKPVAEPGAPPLRAQWLAPFTLSPHDPDVVYHGTNYVSRSVDRGESWQRISPDLTGNDPSRLGDIPFQTVSALAESPLRAGLLYAGTDDGHVHVRRGPGAEWVEISDGLHPDRFTSAVVASQYDQATVYVAQNGRRSDDFAAYVWRSDDYGRTWRSLAGGLPFGPVNTLREDPRNDRVLYVGTDVGVYVSLDRGATWTTLPRGMPSSFVDDLVIHPREDILVAATHGQGMLAFDVRRLQALTPDLMSRDIHLFSAEDGVVSGRSDGARGGVERSAWIHYWLGADARPSLVIRDGGGRLVARLAVERSAGLHRAEWVPVGVEPGSYTAVLETAGSHVTGPVVVRRLDS